MDIEKREAWDKDVLLGRCELQVAIIDSVINQVYFLIVMN
ncbi:hypothetical protein ALQ36_04293 [Pseudomonas syringae pv. primulae]|uniref:Uncharacterized protein n=1 Tax=Pseudomonas syringae pv. primulae TaxID=251707 RepID=A0A3M4RL85_9PSED|nr:hypothetical protein ALQ36_04293 [Pseudomonas syringae pv. primulae]RMR03377.1 hypothetical protein ALP92_04475 [Pseudomonas syringae pv. primulae]